MTFAEARKLDAGAWKNPKYAGEKIPTLDEQIALIPAGKRLFVEIKTGPEIVSELVRCLARCGAGKHNITIISFNYDSLVEIRKRLPDIPTMFLIGYKQPDKNKPVETPQLAIDKVIAQAKAAGFTGLDLQHTWPLTKTDTKRIKDAGLQLHVWTIDNPAKAMHWIELGAQSVTTNRPGWLRKQLNP